MRKTKVTFWKGYEPPQDKLDAFWNLIEDKYEEDWRTDYNGDVVLEVDDDMLERILRDNYSTAWVAFGSYGGGMKPGPKFERYMLERPEFLKGTYIIRGIYNSRGSMEHTRREYSFLQEGA